MRTAICVVLLSILPAVVIVATTGVAQYLEERKAENARGERIVHAIELRQEQLAVVMGTFVRTLGRLDVTNSSNFESVSRLFRNILQSSPRYADIMLLDGAGNVLASALPYDSTTNFSEYAFFKKVRAQDSFGVGRVVFSPFTKEPILHFAAPVPLGGHGMICVALRLAWNEEKFDDRVLPEGTFLYLVDDAGVLASTYPHNDREAIGEKWDNPLWDAVRNAADSSGRIIGRLGTDSTEYVTTYKRLFFQNSGEPYSTILYVQPTLGAHSYATTKLYRDMGLFVAIILLTLCLVAGLYHFSVRRPWNVLLDAAESVAYGKLDVRVPEKGVNGEIGMLYREFNAMADFLERRDNELSAALEHTEYSRKAKSEFLANMSHEIRTSMNAILGMAYLVLKTDMTDKQRAYLSKLLVAANELLGIINDILDFSKIEADKMNMEAIDFSLYRILGAVRSESKADPDSGKTLDLTLDIGQGVPDRLVGDPLRLSQALTILASDAVNRSEQGIVSLRCSVTEQNEERIALRFTVQAPDVVLLPSQIVETREIFSGEKENRSTSLSKTGLRLAIANRLFRMMQGDITVSCLPGQGLLFTARACFTVAEDAAPDKPFEGKKVLVVDANMASRRDLPDILTEFGFAVECVADIEAALHVLTTAQDTSSPFAAMFVDWDPALQDVAEQILQVQQTLPLGGGPLVLTSVSGRTDLPASFDGLEIGAFLSRPLDALAVHGVMTRLIDTDDGSRFLLSSSPGDQKVSFEGLRVLLAEDNVINQQIAAEILEGEGVNLSIADNGEMAVSMLRAAPGAFDLVLMDIQMPIMDGYAATKKIREDAHCNALRLPVIAMTAHSDSSEISACLAAGMNGYTGKPIVIDKLLHTIRCWLPVCAADAAALAASVVELRETCGNADSVSSALRRRQNKILEVLSPVIHEGRLEMLRATLREGDADAIAVMIATFESMADAAAEDRPHKEQTDAFPLSRQGGA